MRKTFVAFGIAFLCGTAVLVYFFVVPGRGSEESDWPRGSDEANFYDTIVGMAKWDGICETLMLDDLTQIAGVEDTSMEISEEIAHADHISEQGSDVSIRCSAAIPDACPGDDDGTISDFSSIYIQLLPEVSESDADIAYRMQTENAASLDHSEQLDIAIPAPWQVGQVNDRGSDRNPRGVEVSAVDDFYVVRIGVLLEGEQCKPETQELGERIASEYMTKLHDSIELRISE